MKKSIACIVLLVSSFAVAASTLDITDLVKKMLAITAESVIVPTAENLVNATLEGAGFYDDIRFRTVYRSVREEAFSVEPVRKNLYAGEDGWYVSARAILLAKMKDYLHKKGNLCKIYSRNYSEKIRGKFSGLKPEFQDKIRAKITSARKTFMLVKSEKIKKDYGELQKMSEADYQSSLDILEKNMTEEETSKLILSDRGKPELFWKTQKDFFAQFEDPSLAQFALRRLHEGGDTLIDEYIRMIDLMAADAK